MRLPLQRSAAPARRDVVVIGGGLTGLSVALHLARAGRAVAVLETDRIGAGASRRTGGIVLEGTHLGPLPGADDCLGELEALVKREAISCDLRLQGCLELAHGAVDGGAAAESSGRDDGRTPSPSGRGDGRIASPIGLDDEGIPCPIGRDDGRILSAVARVPGGTVDPGRLVSGLARAALRAGATLHESASVRAIRAGEPHRLELSHGQIEAGGVVLALNAFADELLPGLPSMRPALTLALATAPLTASQRTALGPTGRWPFYTIDVPYLWGRPLPDGGMVFGSGILLAGERRLDELSVSEGREGFARLEARVRSLRPELDEIPVRTRWAGPIALLRERPPVLAAIPQHPNLWIAGGYTGHGLALALHAGALLARAITRDDPLPSWGALT